MRVDRLEPRFVESMPEELEPGFLYVSIRFRTAQHLCACGCGSRIVTPIKPAKYALTYDGETVSLWPSVGNWQKQCQSHYVIRKSRVEWHAKWSDAQVARGRERDATALRDHYKSRSDEPDAAEPGQHYGVIRSLRGRIAAWFSVRRR